LLFSQIIANYASVNLNRMHLLIATLLAAYRMIVIPVQFEDREFVSGRDDIAGRLSRTESYFNAQFRGAKTFSIDLAPTVTLSHSASYYGANYPDRKDVLLHEAVREACNASSASVDFSAYDNDEDGYVDAVMLLGAGLPETDDSNPDSIWPQFGHLSDNSTPLSLNGKTIDAFAICMELGLDSGGNTVNGGTGVLCHEFAHSMGLKDLYDTDGESSGGLSQGLLGLSIMDEGCLGGDADTPPSFNALDLEMLGIGTCGELSKGSYTLSPVSESGEYLKYSCSNEGEYFLFECREGGKLYIYHIDTSENEAGYSDYYQKTLTASERWEYNQVNCRPDRQCALIVSSGELSNFGSDTTPAFRGWNALPIGLLLSNITSNVNGSVSFEVTEPIEFSDIAVFQDAAIVSWSAEERLKGNITGYEISWTDGSSEKSATLPSDALSYTIEGLSNRTPYRFTLKMITSQGGSESSYSASASFITKIYRSDTYPYIYLSSASRGKDGTFVKGTKIPLRVFNATDVAEVRWFFNGEEIKAGSDGYYTINKSGTLRAEILYSNGSYEFITKEVSL